MDTETESAFVEHIACDECGSKDNNALFDDGHTWCYGCQTYKHGDQQSETPKAPKADTSVNWVHGEYRDLRKRCISAATCKDFDYKIGAHFGVGCHIAPIHNDKGQLVAQTLRLPEKNFPIIGKLKEGGLIFQNKWKKGGKRIVITEGALDALSYATVAPSWPVVSLPNGAAGGVKAIKRSLEFLESFSEVCFLLDSD